MFYLVKSILIALIYLTGVYSNENAEVSTLESVNIPSTLSFEVIEGLMIIDIPGVNGTEHYIFDTGSDKIIFNQKIDKASFLVTGVDQEHKAKEVTIRKLQLGNHGISNVNAWSLDLSTVEKLIGKSLKGIIGSQLLQFNSILIDNDKSEIRFLAHTGSDFRSNQSYQVSILPYTQESEGIPIISGSLGGQTLNLGFDTGANISVFDLKLQNLVLRNSNVSEVLNYLKISNLKLDALDYKLGDFNNLNLTRNNQINGLISPQALDANQIVIDSKRKLIYLFWEVERSSESLVSTH